jgi:hypothetical protein
VNDERRQPDAANHCRQQNEHAQLRRNAAGTSYTGWHSTMFPQVGRTGTVAPLGERLDLAPLASGISKGPEHLV